MQQLAGALAPSCRTNMRADPTLLIVPGLRDIHSGLPHEDEVTAAVEANVRWSMRQILETPEGKARVAEGKMKLVGAVYELETGRVRLLR